MLNAGIFIFALLIFVGLAAMLIVFTPIANKYMQTLTVTPAMLPFSYIFGFYAVGSILIYYFFPLNDFIEPLTANRFFIPLLLAAVIFISSMFFDNSIFIPIVIACVAVTVFLQPLGSGFPYSALPLWAARLLLIAFFSIFCIFYGVLNFLPHTMIISAILTLSGLALLPFFSAAPFYFLLSSALLIGTLAGYLCVNLNTVKVPFDSGSSCALAYLLSNLILQDSGEYSFSSCIIFTAFFWSEFAFALWNKFVIVKSGALYENTNCALAAQKYNLRFLTINVAKICGVSLLIGCFQLFAVNQYSLIIICLAITGWLSHTMLHPFNSDLKTINAEFVADFKQNLANIHNDLKSLQQPDSPQKNKQPKKAAKRKSPRSTRKES